MNILLAEDDADLQSILSQYLEISGVTILQAENGKAGPEIYGNEHVDFCIMDVVVTRLRKYLQPEPDVSLDTIRGVGLILRMN